jgi:hypothetical protein
LRRKRIKHHARAWQWNFSPAQQTDLAVSEFLLNQTVQMRGDGRLIEALNYFI